MRRAMILLVVVLAGTACGPTPTPMPAPPPSPDQLRSVMITGIVDDTVRLVNGRWDGVPVVPGSAMRDMVMLLDPLAVGNVDGQPGDEAVVAVVHSGGGTGSFVYLVVFGTRDAAPVQLGIGLVGDRVEVRGVAVQEGAVQLDVLEAGPADPMCCPTQLARKTFALRGGQLEQVATAVTGVLPDSVP